MTDLRDISGLIREQQTEIERLALWKQDIEAQTAIVMDEECGTDERHCTCVPILRREVERLKRCNESLSLTHASAINGQNQEIGRLRARCEHLEGVVQELVDSIIESEAARAAGGDDALVGN